MPLHKKLTFNSRFEADEQKAAHRTSFALAHHETEHAKDQ